MKKKKEQTIRDVLIKIMDEESIKEMERGFKRAAEQVEAKKRELLSMAKRLRMP